MPPKAPRKKSNTTIVGARFKNCCLIGADSRSTESVFGRVLSNSFPKIFEISEGMCIAGSGDGDILSDVVKFVGAQHESDQPPSIEEYAFEIATWIETYIRQFHTGVHILLIGSVGAEDPKMFLVNAEEGGEEASVEHVKGKFVALGSGEDVAKKELENHIYSKEVTIDEENGCELLFEALMKASLDEHGTGGTLRVAYIANGTSKGFYRKQLNPKYSDSPYGKVIPETVPATYKNGSSQSSGGSLGSSESEDDVGSDVGSDDVS